MSVPGTKGYATAIQRFIDATLAIDFMELHRDFVPFFPKKPGRVLDVGAGIGRDASILAQMGHSVVAVEPLAAFRAAGKQLYDSPHITWIDDALPDLQLPGNKANQFDLILASGVWHHLDSAEQCLAMQTMTRLLKVNGVFLLSLRHGPAGAGSHVFPTDSGQVVTEAGRCSLTTLLQLGNQPSLMRNKEKVTWTRLVFRKQDSDIS